MNESPKVCGAEGCETVLPTYKLHDTLCHEHGRLAAKQARRKQYDPGELEAFRRALLEETLLSLIADPSRWTWASSLETGGNGWEARSYDRFTTISSRRCPGSMCGTLLDAPLPPGRYCSDESSTGRWRPERRSGVS